MCRFGCTAFIGLSILIPALATRIAAEEAQAIATPATLTRFPGDVVHLLWQHDGSTICATLRGVFVSVDDLHHWRPAPALPAREFYSRAGEPLTGYSNFRPVGGDRSRFFVAGDMCDFNPQMAQKQGGSGNYYALASMDAAGKFSVIWDKQPSGAYDFASKLASFGSKHVGAVGWSERTMGVPGGLGGVRNNLHLTIDGGMTWRAVPPPISSTKAGTISCLLWVGPSRLLIAFSDASVQLLERTGDVKLRRVWSVTAPEGATVASLLLDGDYVWIGRGAMKRVKLADGHDDANAKVQAPVQGAGGMAACHGCLLVWGSDKIPPAPRIYRPADERLAPRREVEPVTLSHLDVWGRDPKGDYIRRARIDAPAITGVLPLEMPLCLVIAADGEGFHLDLNKAKLSPVALKVTPLPPPAVPSVNPNVATDKEMEELLNLAKRVPRRDRNAILGAVVKKPGLTNRQQVYLGIKELRQYIETKKPGLGAEPPPPSAEEMQAMMKLWRQLPPEVAGAINTEATKKPELTDRERLLWITEQYRQYLEKHKPKHEDEKQSGREEKGMERVGGASPGGSE